MSENLGVRGSILLLLATQFCHSDAAATLPAGVTSTVATVETDVPATSVTGRVFVDWNDNGRYDAGEETLDSVDVTLRGADETLDWPETRTNDLGVYTLSALRLGSYDNIVPGASYQVLASLSDDFDEVLGQKQLHLVAGQKNVVDIPVPASVAATALGSPEDSTETVQPTSTAAAPTATSAPVSGGSGNAQGMGTVVVGDVFYDDNGNGIRDDNEKSPRYFQLRLFNIDVDRSVLTFTSDTADGTFKIDPFLMKQYGFGPGRYRAVIDGDTTGNNPQWETNIASQDFEIKEDTKLVTLQLAIIPDLYQINISGHVFDDENQNGIWDGDERAHTEWNVYLLQLDDNGSTLNVISESPAQDDGFYAFTPQMMSQNKFRPGKYRVVLNSMIYPQRVWKDNAMVKEFEVRSGRPVTVDFPMSPKALGELVAVRPALATETTTATVTVTMASTVTVTPTAAAMDAVEGDEDDESSSSALAVGISLGLLCAALAVALGTVSYKLHRARGGRDLFANFGFVHPGSRPRTFVARPSAADSVNADSAVSDAIDECKRKPLSVSEGAMPFQV